MTTPVAAERDWTFGGTWPYEPRWFTTSDGIRIHYVDEGPREGESVVLLHGNPTWSYLYRHFISRLADAGFRAIAHDQMGFGRSDKPERESEYTIQRHARHFGELMNELGLDGVTLVLQDWGGPVGLAWAVERPEHVRRLVLLNTFAGSSLPDHPKGPPLPFKLLRAPARRIPDEAPERLHPRDRLPWRHRRSRAPGRRREGGLPRPACDSCEPRRCCGVPTPQSVGRRESNGPLGRHIEENLSRLAERPVLICWPGQDPAFKQRTLAFWRGRFPRAEVHAFDDASHYIQEDAHERVVPLLVEWLRRT